jgi:tetratricopeptide (TPR) repeat protein
MEDNAFNLSEELNDNTITNEYDPKYISRVIDRVIKNKDVIILEPMDYQQRFMTYCIIDEKPNAIGFTIGYGEERRIVLKYRIPSVERLNIKKAIDEYKQDFKTGNYENCIEKIKHFIYTIDRPKAFVFFDMGMCYFKMQDNENAIKYLTLFQKINNETKEDKRDVSELISYLKYFISRKDYKPYAKVNLDEFQNNEQNVNKIEEIKKMVLYSGVTIEKTCEKLGVGDKNIPLIRLIIAKELYLLGKEYIADKLVKVVEKEKNKNTAVKDLLSELIANRKLYMNKMSEEENAPTLSLAKLI